jgi:hypothetical protein
MMSPNPALYPDAPGLSRPLQGKGGANLRRAGKRERWALWHRTR